MLAVLMAVRSRYQCSQPAQVTNAGAHRLSSPPLQRCSNRQAARLGAPRGRSSGSGLCPPRCPRSRSAGHCECAFTGSRRSASRFPMHTRLRRRSSSTRIGRSCSEFCLRLAPSTRVAADPRVRHELTVAARSKQSVTWAVRVTAGERAERALLFVTDEHDKIEETIELWLEISPMPASATASSASSPAAGACMSSLPSLSA
jgi:hypothetical protein